MILANNTAISGLMLSALPDGRMQAYVPDVPGSIQSVVNQTAAGGLLRHAVSNVDRGSGVVWSSSSSGLGNGGLRCL